MPGRNYRCTSPGLCRRSIAPTWRRAHCPKASIEVPIRTLDSILDEANAPARLDFLSIDVEGHEIDVLRGFDFARWNPRLILLEDHVADLAKHHFLMPEAIDAPALRE